ncbi:hypothetical protein C8Q80DRAFT_1114191, partial [Daedaleopsis nitida]
LQQVEEDGDDWPDVEVRYLWCDRSIWEMPLAAFRLSRDLEEAKSQGKRVRIVNFVRFRGANHFAHWDLPEKTLAGFLGDDRKILFVCLFVCIPSLPPSRA